MTQIVRTRFAPSPTGNLHLGHAYSAIHAYNFAKEHGGEFILRIEDIDPTRCKTEHIEQIYEDLSWLGLSWELPVRIQSEHYHDYQKYIQKLQNRNLLYACTCTRKEIQEEIERAGYAPHGPEGTIYPGTCRHKNHIPANEPYALRLNLEKALQAISTKNLYWQESDGRKIQATPEILGDIVIARKDIGTSYHLSVVVDDALQNITHITRGEDLQYATHIQRVLQEVMGLPQPTYVHHKIITDPSGKRFAKRNQSQTLKSYREANIKPEQIYEMIGLKKN